MKEILRLVAVTFVEGALAAWAISGFALDADIKPVIAGGVAAAASLIYNVVRDIRQRVTPSLDADYMGFSGAEGVPSSEDEEAREDED